MLFCPSPFHLATYIPFFPSITWLKSWYKVVFLPCGQAKDFFPQKISEVRLRFLGTHLLSYVLFSGFIFVRFFFRQIWKECFSGFFFSRNENRLLLYVRCQKSCSLRDVSSFVSVRIWIGNKQLFKNVCLANGKRDKSIWCWFGETISRI